MKILKNWGSEYPVSERRKKRKTTQAAGKLLTSITD